MTIFLNLASLLIGLMAWIIALFGVVRRKPQGASWFFCALPLLLQLYEVGNRVRLEDLSAVMDTIRAVNMAGTVLVAVTLLLNLLAFFRQKNTK